MVFFVNIHKYHIPRYIVNVKNRKNVMTSKHLFHVIILTYCLSVAVIILPLGYSMPVHVLAQRIADICQVSTTHHITTHDTTPHRTTPHHTIPPCLLPFHTTPHHIILGYSTPRCNILYCIIPHHITQCSAKLYYTILYTISIL